jgi:dTDP-4-amino-4,6-dideoxygalactose transaminase
MKKKNPPIYVTRPSLPPVEEYEQYVREIFGSRFLTNNGALHCKLESALAEKLDVRHFRLFTNGHLALECAIQAFGLESGEIITTPFTFISTTHAIVRSGFQPVFCDVEPNYYTLDPEQIESCITPKTRAILPVHVYGNPCDVYAIDRIAKKYDLRVLYDAAHAFGVTLAGRGIASFGDAAMFSFHATKSFNTIEGGGVASADAAYAEKLNGLKNFGYHPNEEITEVGGNAKMNEFQAAMGLCNLKHFESEIAKRAKVVARYRQNLAGIDGLTMHPVPNDMVGNFAYFPVTFDPVAFGSTRDDVTDVLNDYGVYPRKYFFPLSSEAACYRGRFSPSDTPVALAASRQVLTLPLFADLALSDVDDICEIVSSCKQ